jgi:hypothetical protein
MTMIAMHASAITIMTLVNFNASSALLQRVSLNEDIGATEYRFDYSLSSQARAFVRQSSGMRSASCAQLPALYGGS